MRWFYSVLFLFNKKNISIFILFYSSSLFAKPIEQLIRPDNDPSHLYSVSKDGQSKKLVNKLMAANVPSLMAVTDAAPTVTNIPQFRSPTPFEVDDIIETLQRMGINLVRLYPPSIVGGGFSENGYITDTAKITGYDKSQAINTSENPTGNKVNSPDAIHYDKVKFEALKQTLAKLQVKGIQVVFPMIDTWCFLGGIPNFVDMVDESYGSDINGDPIKLSRCYGHSKAENKQIRTENQRKITAFYTQERYRNAFKSYVKLLTREFGEYKNIIWETGNELGESARYNGNLLANKTEEEGFSTEQKQRLIDLNLWTRHIAKFIKNQYVKNKNNPTPPPPHLLMDGSYGVDLGVIDNPELTGSLADNNIDIVSNHYYQNWGMNTLYKLDTDKIKLQSPQDQKPYFVGEFMCSYQCDDAFLTEFEAGADENFSTFAGFWSLQGHADQGLHWDKKKSAAVRIDNTFRTGSYNHNEHLGYSSYHYPGFLSKNSDADYNKQGKLTPKHDVVTRFTQLAVRLSGSQKTDNLASTHVVVEKDKMGQNIVKNGKNVLGWAGVSGALGYCLFDNTSHRPMLNNDIQFIDKKGRQFAGYLIAPSVTDHSYAVRPYQYVIHDCTTP
ncbi:hypothetical protein [uncultured Shewanella sp.]|uniref:hypothetical protein n=1 Tax=uncultured Shewanella sp. TaxID=173975 RepID=UPI0026224E3B|nr:hypothetical protein [uncultured Shewanella sp.]